GGRRRSVRQSERRLSAHDDHDRHPARCVDLLPARDRRGDRPHGRARRRLRAGTGPDGLTAGSRASEEVLCVKSEDIFPDGSWHGFVTDGLDRYRAVIRERHFFMPRADIEEDPTYQQIIPYVVFHHGDKYFLTHRLRASAERRLRRQYSLGVGG